MIRFRISRKKCSRKKNPKIAGPMNKIMLSSVSAVTDKILLCMNAMLRHGNSIPIHGDERVQHDCYDQKNVDHRCELFCNHIHIILKECELDPTRLKQILFHKRHDSIQDPFHQEPGDKESTDHNNNHEDGRKPIV